MNKTRYSARWCRNEDGSEGESIALFSCDVPFETMKDFIDSLWMRCYEDVRWLDILDMETGEVIYECNNWDYEKDDCDNDCGFDPYMGCFTDDC